MKLALFQKYFTLFNLILALCFQFIETQSRAESLTHPFQIEVDEENAPFFNEQEQTQQLIKKAMNSILSRIEIPYEEEGLLRTTDFFKTIDKKIKKLDRNAKLYFGKEILKNLLRYIYFNIQLLKSISKKNGTPISSEEILISMIHSKKAIHDMGEIGIEHDFPFFIALSSPHEEGSKILTELTEFLSLAEKKAQSLEWKTKPKYTLVLLDKNSKQIVNRKIAYTNRESFTQKLQSAAISLNHALDKKNIRLIHAALNEFLPLYYLSKIVADQDLETESEKPVDKKELLENPLMLFDFYSIIIENLRIEEERSITLEVLKLIKPEFSTQHQKVLYSLVYAFFEILRNPKMSYHAEEELKSLSKEEWPQEPSMTHSLLKFFIRLLKHPEASYKAFQVLNFLPADIWLKDPELFFTLTDMIKEIRATHRAVDLFLLIPNHYWSKNSLLIQMLIETLNDPTGSTPARLILETAPSTTWSENPTLILALIQNLKNPTARFDSRELLKKLPKELWSEHPKTFCALTVLIEEADSISQLAAIALILQSIPKENWSEFEATLVLEGTRNHSLTYEVLQILKSIPKDAWPKNSPLVQNLLQKFKTYEILPYEATEVLKIIPVENWKEEFALIHSLEETLKDRKPAGMRN